MATKKDVARLTHRRRPACFDIRISKEKSKLQYAFYVPVEIDKNETSGRRLPLRWTQSKRPPGGTHIVNKSTVVHQEQERDTPAVAMKVAQQGPQKVIVLLDIDKENDT